MKKVEATFRITYTEEQYEKARKFVEDMKRHPERIYWFGKEGKTDEELIYGYIIHHILSGFYGSYDLNKARQILEMTHSKELIP